jgi:hypothetical protein
MQWDQTSVGRASGAGGMSSEVPPDREQGHSCDGGNKSLLMATLLRGSRAG